MSRIRGIMYRIFSAFASEVDLKCELEYGAVYHKLDKYINNVHKSEYAVSYDGNKSVRENKTIWICWQQGMEHAPKLVKRCYDSVCINKPSDFQVILLTDQNIQQYIRLLEYIVHKYEKGIISRAHYADLIRLELLCRYGGCWVDATVYCSGRIPKEYLSGDLFVFKGAQTSFLRFSNWWIYAAKGNSLIQDMRDMLFTFWKEEDRIPNYFIFHIILSKLIDTDISHRTMFQNIPYFTNVYPHMLQGVFGAAYSKEKWDEIKGKSMVHKLAYKYHYVQGDIYKFCTAFLNGDLE